MAVGLTPETLPAIVTTCLARGATLLARTHGVIVKRLPALHDLGAMDVLCVDKTGTLTRDRPVVAGSLGPDGRADPEALRWAGVNSWWTLRLAELPAPDALDEAPLEATGTIGEEYDGVDAAPHDPGRRLASALLRGPCPGTHTLVVKGAVRDVLDHCALEPGERTRLDRLAAREADSGLRVLAVATTEVPAGRPGLPALAGRFPRADPPALARADEPRFTRADEPASSGVHEPARSRAHEAASPRTDEPAPRTRVYPQAGGRGTGTRHGNRCRERHHERHGEPGADRDRSGGAFRDGALKARGARREARAPRGPARPRP